MADNHSSNLNLQTKAAALAAASTAFPRANAMSDNAGNALALTQRTASGLNSVNRTLSNGEILERIPARLATAVDNSGTVMTPVAEIGGTVALPLAIGTGVFDMATAQAGRERQIAVASNLPTVAVATGATGMGVSGTLGGAGLTASMGAAAVTAAPALVAAGALGFLIKDSMLNNDERAHDARLRQILPDVHGQGHLRDVAQHLDDALTQQGAPGLQRGGDGAIDLNNESNQQLLASSLDAQRKLMQSALNDAQSGIFQMSVLPEGLKNYRKELASFTLEESKAKLDVSLSELNTLRTKTVGAAPRTLQQTAGDIAKIEADMAAGKNTVEILPFTYGLRHGLPITDPLHASTNPELPPAVLAMYNAMEKKGPIKNLIYKPDGVTPEKLVIYNIVEPDGMNATHDVLKASSQPQAAFPTVKKALAISGSHPGF